MRKVEWDEYGPLVYKKRYKQCASLLHNPGLVQRSDARVIQLAAQAAGLNNFFLESEWVDYIEDFETIINHRFKLQRVSFDHVLFTGDTCIILESDDRSHYDPIYCKYKNWDYLDIKRRDEIKDNWAKRTNTLLIRLPEHHLNNDGSIGKRITQKEKLDLLTTIFKNIKDA